jgi:hypothetical protein
MSDEILPFCFEAQYDRSIEPRLLPKFREGYRREIMPKLPSSSIQVVVKELFISQIELIECQLPPGIVNPAIQIFRLDGGARGYKWRDKPSDKLEVLLRRSMLLCVKKADSGDSLQTS